MRPIPVEARRWWQLILWIDLPEGAEKPHVSNTETWGTHAPFGCVQTWATRPVKEQNL